MSKQKTFTVLRMKSTGRRTYYLIETDGKKYLRVFFDDIDSGFELEFPEGMVKELFKKLDHKLKIIPTKKKTAKV